MKFRVSNEAWGDPVECTMSELAIQAREWGTTVFLSTSAGMDVIRDGKTGEVIAIREEA